MSFNFRILVIIIVPVNTNKHCNPLINLYFIEVDIGSAKLFRLDLVPSSDMNCEEDTCDLF